MVTLDRALPVAPVVDPVQAVRRFNRFYTRQIGVLQEHLLESQFSLTEVRVLYELSHRGSVTAVDLREVLGLDRGYLSRMLQKFEERGWIKAIPSPADRRRLFLSLTSKGEKIFAPLDRRSSEEVAAMLAKLPSPRQTALVRGMREIESILHPSRPTEPTFILRRHRSGDMGWVVHRHGVIYAKEYGYDECFEALVAEIVAGFIKNFDAKRERCWIAERDGEVVGSIFLVKKSRTVAKLRLLLVEPSARGLGIGDRLISECVQFARRVGFTKIVLWTQSELHAAHHLYEKAGFKRFPQEAHRSWGKDVIGETWQLSL